MEFILGSQSPRRVEILGYFSLPFRQVASHFDEESVPFTGDPAHYATALSMEKAKVLRVSFPEAIILTADTVVSIDGLLLGKPKDDAEGLKMLNLLQGRTHSVITAVSVVSPMGEASGHEETKVICNSLTPEEIRHYMQKHTLTDKAGGYAIQKSGSLLVKGIEGCYYNVCGLPVNTVRTVLQKIGIDLWDYLKEFD